MNNKDRALLQAIYRTQAQILNPSSPQHVFEKFLKEFLILSDSEFGLINEILYTEENKPYIAEKPLASMVVLNELSKKTYSTFDRITPNLSNTIHSLFYEVVSTGKPIIANDGPYDTPNKNGDSGNPLLHFLGLPLISNSKELVGVIGLANHPKGYNQELIEFLHPLVLTCSNIIATKRVDNHREQAVNSLMKIRDELEARISERTEELISSKERMNLALQSSKVGTWTWDIVKDEITWDDYISPLYGLKPGTFPKNSESFFNLVHPDDRERIKQEVQNTLQRNIKYDTEFKVLWDNGSLHTLAARGKVYRNPSGNPLKMTGVCWDITDRKTAEVIAKEANEKLSSIVSRNVEAMLVTNLDGEIQYANPMATIFFSNGKEGLIGKRIELPTGLNSPKEITIFQHNGEPGIGEMIMVTTTWRGEEGLLIVVHDITERRRVETTLEKKSKSLQKAKQKLAALASFDELTGLKNRRYFQIALLKTISNCKRYAKKFALLLIDVDNFKWINDSLGHGIGDVTLNKIASIFKNTTNENDIVARIGGDEFAILLTKINSHSEAIAVAHRILNFFQTTLHIKSIAIRTSVSIGMTFYPPQNQTHQENMVELLFKQADIALYKAKKRGKGRVALYSEQTQESYTWINEVELGLQYAMEKKELSIFYQPIVNMTTNHIVGVEALLRWRHERLGQINPMDFIPIAERTGLIHSLGLWIFTEVCKQAYIWKKKGIDNLFLAINISPIQLQNNNFTKQIVKLLQEYHLDPSQIELEITESSITEENDFFSPKFLSTIRRKQIKLALDDFGTGYSSLARLAELPVSTLKIDGSFIKDLELDSKNYTIVRSAIALAKSLSINIIAECVESKEQAEILLQLGCQIAQGFYYHNPAPVKEVSSLLIANRKNRLR